MSLNRQVGDLIDNLWKIRKILYGGMGVVYIVKHPQHRLAFAIKTFKDVVFDGQSDAADRFIQEALIWINLDVHQNVTRADFIQEIEGKPHLFLEYVSGGDLSSWVGTPRLTENLPQALDFAIQFCDGMTHALSKGLMAHRDIKPQNCLITSDKVLKISDFGVAKVLYGTDLSIAGNVMPVRSGSGLGLTRPKGGMGTPYYMAPEQFDNAKDVDVRADIYSFGVMLFQMVTGELPFEGSTFKELRSQHLAQEPPPIVHDAELGEVVARCLRKNPRQRFGDFKEVRERLAGIYERLTNKRARRPALGKNLEIWQALNKASSLGRLGYLEEASAWYSEVLRVAPDLAMAWVGWARVLTQSERAEDALICCEQAEAIDPSEPHVWSLKGYALQSLGRTEEAVACYDRELEADPHSIDTLMNKGTALAALGRTEEAFACYDRAIELNPNDVGSLINKGAELAREGRGDEAMECYRQAIELDPGSAGAWINIGFHLEKLGRLDEAIAKYDHALRLDPRLFEAWFNRGAALSKLGWKEDAIDSYEQALKLRPNHVGALNNKMGKLIDLGRVEEALACAHRILKINPRYANAWYAKGLIASRDRRFNEALKYFRKAKRLGLKQTARAIKGCQAALEALAPPNTPENVGSAEQWRDMAFNLMGKGRWENALAYLEKALELSPDYADAWGGKALALMSLHQTDEAFVCIDRAIKLNPFEEVFWMNRGAFMSRLGRTEDEVVCYTRALEINPDWAEAWLCKADAMGRLGRSDEAVDCLKETIRIDPQSDRAWHSMGVELSLQGKTEESLVCFDKAVGINPDYAAAWYNRGVSLRELGRTDEEADSNERALKINPDFVEALLSKAWRMEKSGEMAKALTCYERITKIDPSHARAWYSMAQVLFEGFQHYREARACLEKSLELGYPLAEEALAICREVLDE